MLQNLEAAVIAWQLTGRIPRDFQLPVYQRSSATPYEVVWITVDAFLKDTRWSIDDHTGSHIPDWPGFAKAMDDLDQHYQTTKQWLP